MEAERAAGKLAAPGERLGLWEEKGRQLQQGLKCEGKMGDGDHSSMSQG